MDKLSDVVTLRFAGEALELLDQTRLPHAERWLVCTRPEEVAEAIRRLAVRGAPAIGVAAAYGVALSVAAGSGDAAARFAAARDLLLASRPTAVNLRWALERQSAVATRQAGASAAALFAALVAEARVIEAEDRAACAAMGEHGATLFASGERVLTHCNAGALATAGAGTALAVVRAAFRQGNVAQVWVDETRPLLQGARLTAWELSRLGVPHRLVADNMVGALMSRGLVSRVVVGADRIAANGDAANKIGTYTVAVLAARHGVPFHVVAPRSTIDPRIATGAEIPIEERDGGEVTHLAGQPIAPAETRGFNLAFDVTPAELITAIVTEVGVHRPPYGPALAAALASSPRAEQ